MASTTHHPWCDMEDEDGVHNRWDFLFCLHLFRISQKWWIIELVICQNWWKMKSIYYLNNFLMILLLVHDDFFWENKMKSGWEVWHGYAFRAVTVTWSAECCQFRMTDYWIKTQGTAASSASWWLELASCFSFSTLSVLMTFHVLQHSSLNVLISSLKILTPPHMFFLSHILYKLCTNNGTGAVLKLFWEDSFW